MPGKAFATAKIQRRNLNRSRQASYADEDLPGSSVTYAMLISESVYRLVVLVERIIRWIDKAIFRPCLLYYRFLRW
jgi:hypothetical protein